MKWKIAVILLLAGMTGVLAATALAGTDSVGETTECTSAMEVIERNLEVLGGAERFRAVETLIIEGATGSSLLPASEQATLYLKKPNLFKQVGAFRIVLADGDRFIHNDGNALTNLSGGNLEGLLYRIGFYHNAFSLLKWEEHFPSAELVGIKEYGPVRYYEIRFPGAENGRDLLVYVDTETFLVDRLVYVINQEGAGTLQVVNQLRDWREFDGIRIPTRVVFDKIGWETTPTHFVISDVKVNPPLEEGLFESADVDFGAVAVEGNTVRGEIFGDMDGSLLTNVRREDLAEAGIEELSWLDLEVGAAKHRVRYLGNIQASAAHIKPDEIYITTYPICGYPRMMLMGWEIDLTERIDCEKGDGLVLSPIEGDEPEGEEAVEEGE